MPDDPRPTPLRRPPANAGQSRHELPAVDEAALEAARRADVVIAAAQTVGSDRWVAYLEPIAERLRDGEPRDLRPAALRARAAYGPKDSVRDVLPPEVTGPLLDAIDRLLKVLNRREVA